MTRLAIGRALVSIDGDSPIARLLVDELLTDSPSSDRPLDLRVTIGERSDSLTDAARLTGSRLLTRHEVRVDGSALSLRMGLKMGPTLYRADLSGHPFGAKPVHAQVHVPFTSTTSDLLMRPFTRVATRDYLTLHELIAKNLLYEIFEPLLWCRLLRSGSTLAHAGAAATPDGRGVLFFGSGGVGKSTATLALVVASKWSYLSDDLAVLEPGPNIVHYPKKLQVYAYNTSLVEGLQDRLLAGRGSADRTVWAVRRGLLGLKQARRRIRAAHLLGDGSVAQRAPLWAAVFITPGPRGGPIALTPFNHDSAASILARSLIEEFWDYLRLLHAASILEPTFPSAADLHQATAAVAAELLPEERSYRLAVPPGMPGELIARAVEAEFR